VGRMPRHEVLNLPSTRRFSFHLSGFNWVLGGLYPFSDATVRFINGFWAC